MKETKNLPNKYNYILIIGFSIFFMMLIIYFTINRLKYEDELAAIHKLKINGLITESKDERRGFYFIRIKDNISKTNLDYSLPSSWFFINNKIQISDSVYKDANSKVMTFYKYTNGQYKKCCDYEIDM